MSAMSEGRVHYSAEGGVGRVVFDRPAARNAMTFAMYDALADICDAICSDPTLRVVTLRGAGGEAFVAGTDIAQFTRFEGGDDGIAYERRIDAQIAQIEALPVPTLAIIDGWTIGGGLAIAAACDLRIAVPTARFGVPIARTLGNCLSMANMARVAALFGPARVKRMLIGAQTLDAQEALVCGFLAEIVQPDDLDSAAERWTGRLAAHAPITMRVSKEALRRLVEAGLPDGDDLVKETYASADFKEGVDAFLAKRPANFRNR